MKKILGFISQPWVVSLLGVIALSLIIWYIGPLVAIAGIIPLEGDMIRLIVIAILVVIWAGWWAIKKIISGLAERQIAAGIAKNSENDGLDYATEEVAQLKTHFDEAIKVLKQSGKNKQGKAGSLYDLPWYIIIGPPGAGKTTALANSGLTFPLADRLGDQAVQGVGGTRNCDWWFSDEAVLIDTAGRYVTQDSQAEVDRAAWTGFLDLLKKYRRRRPINGIFVAISLSDLIVQNEYDRQLHVNAIKKRIHELYQHFGMRFPVYVLITKCDLIAGFTEFFDDLGREEREQVWGITFPLEDQPKVSVVERLGHEFDGLLQRINERLIGRLGQERDNQRRTLIYGFPQQVASLKETLDLFIKDIFQPSRYDEALILRGVYFTSGTQEGTPIDRVMGSLARSFGLNQQAIPSFGGKNRAYFITDLLKKVVIPEAQIAGTNHRLERRRVWLQNGAYVAAAGLTLLCIIAWVVSYNQNQQYLENAAMQIVETQENMDALTSAHRDPLLARLPLNMIKAITPPLNDADNDIPWTMGFGLYQGEHLGLKARAAYQRLLNRIFLPRLILRIEKQLKSGARDPEYLFAGLKVYLMFREQEYFDADTLSAWILLDWERNRPRDFNDQRMQEMREHLDALLAIGPPALPIALDERLITDVRKILKRVPLAERAYGSLKRANLRSKLPFFNLVDAGGGEARTVFSRRSGQPLSEGIDGFFTYAGFHERFLPQSQVLSEKMAAERWVIGEEESNENDTQALALLNAEVLRLYLNDYIDQWENLLADIQLSPVSDINHGVEMLNILSAPNSPLRKILEAVKKETSLTYMPSDDSALLGKIASKTMKRSRVGRFVDADDIRGAVNRNNDIPGQKVDKHFSTLNKLVTANNSGGMPIEQILMGLNKLYAALDGIASSPNPGQTAMKAINSNGSLRNVSHKMKMRAKRQPQFLNHLMTVAATRSKRLADNVVREHFNDVWESKARSICRRSISNRYPVSRHSSRDITLDDFGRFFGSAGIMDNFYNDYLAEFVNTNTEPWRWRSVSGMSTRVLEQFRRASIIREVLFQGRGQLPHVNFKLKPINMDAEITRFLLSLNGQKISYSHGPIRLSSMQWPGDDDIFQVKLQLFPILDGLSSSVRERGPWAWFRVLDDAQIKMAPRSERYRLTFDIEGRKVNYELRVNNDENPFRLAELTTFSCPEKF